MEITKTDKILIPAVIFFLLFWFVYSNYFTKGMIVGTYVKIGESANISFIGNTGPDTLILFENNIFRYNNDIDGTYEIFDDPFSTKIRLSWYEKGIPYSKIGLDDWGSYFTRIWFSRIRIVLDSDSGIYYEKIK